MIFDPYSRVSIEIVHLLRKLSGRRRLAQRRAKAAFAEAMASLGPGDVAIDLGANVGEFTVPLAETGAKVIAFEPDPHAFSILSEKTREFPNVTVVQAAAGDREGRANLYRSKEFDREPDRRTKSSSLFSEKRNVGESGTVEVQIVNFTDYLLKLDRDIALIKMDVEGAEIPLMEALLASSIAKRVSKIFVETHERGLPHLAQRTAALKAATRELEAPSVNWDWH